jgi:tRNA (guanine37-N1)-methyltransferase
MAIVESVSRLLPGVLGNEQSLSEESHAAGLLEYPQYTRPRSFRGIEVPAVLLSGNHAAIARWRRKQALLRTRALRPDLFASLTLEPGDRALLDEPEDEP